MPSATNGLCGARQEGSLNGWGFPECMSLHLGRRAPRLVRAPRSVEHATLPPLDGCRGRTPSGAIPQELPEEGGASNLIVIKIVKALGARLDFRLPWIRLPRARALACLSGALDPPRSLG